MVGVELQSHYSIFLVWRQYGGVEKNDSLHTLTM